MSNGVRNLRAMFENPSAASSPEPRGRSPVDYIAAGDGDDRPKSKVRANFVSVEPTSAPNSAHASTDLGTTKGTPTNSINAQRRGSFRVSEDKPDELADLKQSVSDEKEERRKSLAIPEAVPEQAVASRESSVPAPPIRQEPAGDVCEEPAGDMTNLGSIMKGSDFPEPSPQVEEKVPEVPESAAEVEEAATVGAVVGETPAASEPEQKLAEAAEPAPEPSPETAPIQPAENPDKATMGEQVDLPLRPVVPTEEVALADETPAVDEAAVENKLVKEQAAIDEAAIAEEEPPAPAPAADQPADNPDKAVTGAQEDVLLRSAAPTDETDILDNKAPAATEDVPAASSEAPAETPKSVVSKPKTNGTLIAKKSEPKKPAAISTANPSKAPSSSAKSPLPKPAPKTPTNPKAKAAASVTKPSSAVKAPKPAPAIPKPAALKEPTKAPVTKAPVAKTPAGKAPVAKTSRTSLRPAASSSATAPTASAAAKTTKPSVAPVENKKPAVTKSAAPAPRTSISPSGFKKPRPKSPTRPVGLPTRLTAPTAASAAKHGEEPKVTRKPSTTTRPAPKTTGARPSRASVAPSAPKRPDSRASTASAAPKGGNFLERMMRPTAASSSKTHEKPASPPRKTAVPAKPSTLQKGKKKVEEMASKAKDAVTNGHDDGEHKAEDEAANGTHSADQATEGATADEIPHEPTKAATPVQDVDSSVAELQTPHFDDATVR